MTILRQEVKIYVTGAQQAEKELKGVAGAGKGIEAAAVSSAVKLNILGREITGAAASADKMRDSVKKAETGVLAVGKSTSAASGAMSMLRKAAELIPGVELGTIFAAAATGAAMLASELFGASDAAMALAKSGDVLTEGAVAEAMKVDDLTDGMDRYARAMGLANAKAMTFLEHQRALRSIATGETKDVGVEFKRTEALAEELAALNEYLKVAIYAGTAEDKLSRLRTEIAVKTDELLAQDMETRILMSGPSQDKTAGWFAAAAADARKAEASGAKAGARKQRPGRIDARDKVADFAGASAIPGFGSPSPDFAGASVVPGFGDMESDSAFIAKRLSESRDARLAAMQKAIADSERIGVLGPFQREDTPPSIVAMLTASDAEREKFSADMEFASSATQSTFAGMGSNIATAHGMLEGLGKGFAQAAAATIILGGGFKRAANEMLKGLAVQALGQALWEGAMGTASLGMAFLGHPGALASAEAHFQAAGMFGVIAAGAALGAAGTGGFRSRGGGGASASAAGTNPYQGSAQGGTVVNVMIGGEVVTRGVQVETRRQSLRGGISEPRMAMAT